MAREFKGSDTGSASTCASASGIGARLVLLMHFCFQRCLGFIDVKDVFLLVPPREWILVEKIDGGVMKTVETTGLGTGASVVNDMQQLGSPVSCVKVSKDWILRIALCWQVCSGTRPRN